jgi:transcriptional regulator GlxA family with amidase domain
MVTGSRQNDVRIQSVVKVLTEDPSRSLPELADSCHISVSRLIHLFRDEIGINVKSYRLGCRLQVAAAMLVSTGIPIKAIACRTGYRHTSSFTRAFKAHFGVSPDCYRRGQRRQAA